MGGWLPEKVELAWLGLAWAEGTKGTEGTKRTQGTLIAHILVRET